MLKVLSLVLGRIKPRGRERDIVHRYTSTEGRAYEKNKPWAVSSMLKLPSVSPGTHPGAAGRSLRYVCAGLKWKKVFQYHPVLTRAENSPTRFKDAALNLSPSLPQLQARDINIREK